MMLIYLFLARPRILFIYFEDEVTRVKCISLFPAGPRLLFIYLKNVITRMKCI
jgi:hypothetical protein